MNGRQVVITVCVACVCAFVCATIYAGVETTACDATCTTENCANRVTYNGDGYVAGCTQNGENCAGQCYKCTAGATTDICVRSVGSTCKGNTSLGTFSCGKKTYYPCAGTWPNCTCNDGGGGTSSDDGCTIAYCIP